MAIHIYMQVIPSGYNTILFLDLEGYERVVIPTIQQLPDMIKPVALIYEYTRMQSFLDVPEYSKINVIDQNVFLLNNRGMHLKDIHCKKNNHQPSIYPQ